MFLTLLAKKHKENSNEIDDWRGVKYGDISRNMPYGFNGYYVFWRC